MLSDLLKMYRSGCCDKIGRVIFIAILIVTLAASEGMAQVGINTSLPDSSAVLDVTSTAKGVLFPRMNESQRDAIINPAIGLMIFNIDTKCINMYNGVLWTEICGHLPRNYSFIDGIYVSSKGDDVDGDGTIQFPYKTVSKGYIQLGVQNKDTLIIAGGEYQRTEISMDLDTGIIIYGGYEDVFWSRNILAYPTNIYMDSSLSFSVTNSEDIKLEGLNIYATFSDVNGSYGLRVVSSTQVLVDSCYLSSGIAKHGAIGFDGANGTPSTPGMSSTFNAGGGGGMIGGGIGGIGGNPNSSGGAGAAGNGGAAGGAGGSPGNSGGNGLGGANGTNGDDGQGGIDIGVSGPSYLATNDGENGKKGKNGDGGGGGGGAGGTAIQPGNGGGGGGGGGAGGGKGIGGEAGAGSFGLYAYNSSVIVNNSVLESKDGGAGGESGAGGVGATGSAGGNGGNGGNGGFGGFGGFGGIGGGGGGGPSYGAYSAGVSTVTLNNVTLIFGSPGIGGASAVNAGSIGTAGDKNF